ncbi:MAG: rod shape-determining protein [Candidatus Marinimicrobia bacterium]|jgi:rod shape-determining protein MreB|nr:rod shape-determining protein [Candidatus Neomarinimicrobiota bacterium]MDD5709253.1 rod shape-determining protein [Candidatus Neomarinimicrobiota bacterium]MDX9777356.1 rod shape-determining protein [bacterium]
MSMFKWLNSDIAIDLGTANTLIFMRGQGIVINEPSIVSKSTKTGKIIAVGNEAREMMGRTHPNIMTIRPMKDGVIADFEMTDGMLQGFIKKIQLSRFARPKIVICVPSGITEVEKRAVQESAERANASRVYLIEEPVAAAIGIGIDISKPIGSMIVDIGGGTTEIAVLALNGVVAKESIRVAGDELNNAIVHYFRGKHNLLIGERTAEEIKKAVGSAIPMEEKIIAVKGRNLLTGIPRTVEVDANDVSECLQKTIEMMIAAIKRTLEHTPPELSADIMDRGIILTGGGSLLNGLDERVRRETNLPVVIADEPLLSVAKGTGKVLENLENYMDILL